MPYCGMSWVSPGVTTCPDGSRPTAVPAGQEAGPGQTSTLPNEPVYMWNQDTTPVVVGTEQQWSGNRVVDYPQTTTVSDAMNYFYDIRGKGTSANASKEDKKSWSNLLTSLRSYTNQELGTSDAQASAFGQVLKYASRSGESVPAILSGATGEDAGFIDGGGRGSGAAGAYTGPRTNVTMASERDLRMTADAVAATVVGRAVTDDEFKRVLDQVRSAEKAEPSVTTGGVGMTTSQAGLSAEGRQDIIREALMQGPEAESFGRATKMMDLFYSALEERPSGA